MDLLEFLNPEGALVSFLEKWKDEHGGEPYDGPKYGYQKPFDALIERRPDLPHLPLTCENTHTALPYIDVVNEVLEYFVAKEKLEAEAAQDTGAATTSELLAEPQNILPEAYDKLNELALPVGAAFRSVARDGTAVLELLRNAALAGAGSLSLSDDLFALAQPFDRAASSLNTWGSPRRGAIFSDPDPLGRKWHELYGFPTARPNRNPAVHVTLTVASADA